MTTAMPVLETERLLIRPFTLDDLEAVHQILDLEEAAVDLGQGETALAQRRRWLEWSVLNYEQLAGLYQPPYGDRGVALKATGELIGACGYVPCVGDFLQLPALAAGRPERGLATCEFGLYYAISPRCRRQGYAAEAARALIDYAFRTLRLKRVIATTDYDNLGSIGVMLKVGMQIERNPYPDPPWLQVVGWIENDLSKPE